MTAGDADRYETGSHPRIRISWNIPAPVIITIILQAAVIGWVGASWKSTMEGTIRVVESRVTALETATANSSVLAERVIGVEMNVEVLKTQSHNIESKIDKLIDRGLK